jgi:transcriptional regulator with XRE-family HTH domain
MFAKNLTSLRKARKLTQHDAAQLLGLHRATYACYEKGKTEPPASVLLKMADCFHVSAEFLMRGAPTAPPLFHQPPEVVPALHQQARVLVLTVGPDERENIQYVSYAASAGYVSEYNQGEFMEQLPHFRLPKLGLGTFRAFEIKGDSMPPIHDGYIVVGRFVEHARDLHDGKRYVFITRSAGVLFKQLVREARRPHRFILVSDNPAYVPYSVDAADIVEAWELVTFIGSLAVYQDPAPLLNARLHAMEQKIDRLTHTPT